MDESQDAPQFEELLSQFDEAVASLESDGLSLEEALSKYESAVKLADECARILRTAELRVSEVDSTLQDLDCSSES